MATRYESGLVFVFGFLTGVASASAPLAWLCWYVLSLPTSCSNNDTTSCSFISLRGHFTCESPDNFVRCPHWTTFYSMIPLTANTHGKLRCFLPVHRWRFLCSVYIICVVNMWVPCWHTCGEELTCDVQFNFTRNPSITGRWANASVRFQDEQRYNAFCCRSKPLRRCRSEPYWCKREPFWCRRPKYKGTLRSGFIGQHNHSDLIGQGPSWLMLGIIRKRRGLRHFIILIA